MAGVVVIRGFTSGKTTRKGKPVEPDFEGTVVAVAPSAIDQLIGARSLAERTAHLRKLRDQGVLLTRPGRGKLTHKLRGPGLSKAYIFALEDPLAVPQIERPPTPGRARMRTPFKV